MRGGATRRAPRARTSQSCTSTRLRANGSGILTVGTSASSSTSCTASTRRRFSAAVSAGAGAGTAATDATDRLRPLVDPLPFLLPDLRLRTEEFVAATAALVSSFTSIILSSCTYSSHLDAQPQ